MSLENLWGELPQTGTIRTPLVILREQAAFLGDMTNRILESGIHAQRNMLPGKFIADLNIIAPTLDRYRITIAQIKYDLTKTYPVELVDTLAGKADIVHTKEEFIRALESILNSEKVQRVISSLLLQVGQ